MKEMTGSGIFKAKGENGVSDTEDDDGQTPVNKTGLRMYQVCVKLHWICVLEFQWPKSLTLI